ncbi:hypothetical protein [Metallibacterium scheffleri]|jgi:hypothetical protein|uniref:Uncharacterized protein n=2 Tax=Lysobacterales TaxID=135614 RepID=A0A4V3USS4_9GAMM|nr:hypothetical protein [Metallibacterium scheffleri]THD07771.1 hypothetical protein B1806_14535 [Metallibacterium scheffleri]
MPTSKEQKPDAQKRGPKPLTLPQRLAVRVWAFAIQKRARSLADRSGPRQWPANLTPYEVERVVHGDTHRWRVESDGIKRPKQFDAYLAGLHWPNARTRATFRQDFPELEYWLDLDLWSQIEAVPPPMSRLHEIMRMARPSLRALLYERTAPGDPLNPSLRRVAMPRADAARVVRAEGDLEALTVLFALLREAECIGDIEGHTAVAREAINLLFALAVDPPWVRVASDIFRHLRRSVLVHVPSTVEGLRLAEVNPDHEISLRLDMLFAAQSAGVNIDDASTTIAQMALLDRLGRNEYLEHLKRTSTTGRIVLYGHGIVTGSLDD